MTTKRTPAKTQPEPTEWVEQRSDYVVVDGVLVLRRDVDSKTTDGVTVTTEETTNNG